MKNLIILPISILIISCANITPPIPTDIMYCGSAEIHLHDLCARDPINNQYCCQVVAPTKLGKSFTTFCNETEANNISLHAQCLSTITTCNQIDICEGTTK